jgi:hypothetical protein
MGDDLIVGGILPDDTLSDDKEFDPDAFESDDILDDVAGDTLLDKEDLPLDELDDDEPIEENE